jgi:aryl sulfotransferase
MPSSGRIVWLASFPKSGNTWFRILLANLTTGEFGPADINNLDERGGIASSRDDFEAATMLDSGIISHDDIDGLRPRVYEFIVKDTTEQRWIKVHDAYTYTLAGQALFSNNAVTGAVYLVRDPRDVAVSLAYHSNTTVDDAIKVINATDGMLCCDRRGLAPQLRQKLNGWSQHVTSWLDQPEVPVHLVRYEDLLIDTEKYFKAALEFAKRFAQQEDIARAICSADFSELRRQENEKGFRERMSRAAPFFRSGRVGSWRESLSASQASSIERCHSAVMMRLGYSV